MSVNYNKILDVSLLLTMKYKLNKNDFIKYLIQQD